MGIHTAFLAVALAIGMQAQPEFRDPGPELVRASTTRVSASTVLGLWGENLYSPKEPQLDDVRIVFEQADRRFEEEITGATPHPEFSEAPHDRLDVEVPASLVLGPCRVHVERDGFQSASLVLEVVAWEPPDVTSVEPSIIPRTAYFRLEGAGFHTTDELEIVDSAGAVFRVRPGRDASCEGHHLPDNFAEGAARVRIVREGDHDSPSTAWFDFKVDDGPQPLDFAESWMQPAAPGQWIDVFFMSRHAIEGADRAELVFEQASGSFIAECVRTDALRVQVPTGLAAGPAMIRGRTWRASVASPWSKSASYTVLDRPALTEVSGVYASSASDGRHFAELGSDELVLDPQDHVVIYGRFPVAVASDLVAEFESASNRLEIVCEGSGGAVLYVPTAGKLPCGVWSLTLVRRGDGLRTPTPLRIVVPGDRDSRRSRGARRRRAQRGVDGPRARVEGHSGRSAA